MSPKPKDARRKPSRASVDGQTPLPARKKKSRKVIKSAKTSPAPLDQLGELPRSHGTDRIFLIARDPHRLYCYWDIDISRHPGGPTYLRSLVGSEDALETELPVTFESRNHELPARRAGSRYTVELGYLRGTQWHCLARSATVETPPDRMANTPGTTFTTIPRPADPSTPLLSSTSDQTTPTALAELPLQHRRILETLLGENFLIGLSSASFSSEEISSRIRIHLMELLSSGSASEHLARIPGALAALSGSSEHSAQLPTLTTAQLTQWTRETLSSFVPESSWSSWVSSGLESSGLPVSSWTVSPGSHFLSSWMSGSSRDFSSWDHLSSSSSWGSHGVNLSSPGQGEEDILRLHAEMYLHGRIRPGTHLTIDGRSVSVQPDGSFRHHLTCADPENSREVTLVATTPDGKESRRTTLRLDRQTDFVTGLIPRSEAP